MLHSVRKTIAILVFVHWNYLWTLCRSWGAFHWQLWFRVRFYPYVHLILAQCALLDLPHVNLRRRQAFCWHLEHRRRRLTLSKVLFSRPDLNRNHCLQILFEFRSLRLHRRYAQEERNFKGYFRMPVYFWLTLKSVVKADWSISLRFFTLLINRSLSLSFGFFEATGIDEWRPV